MVVKSISKKFRVFITILLLLILLFPIYWVVISSLQPNDFLFKLPPHFTLKFGTINNYQRVLANNQYVKYFFNSMLISTCTVILSIFASILAAYALSRIKIKGKNAILVFILSIQMFPIVGILITLYTFFCKWHLLNTYFGVILADTTFSLPLSIVLLKSFIDTVPYSLDEAAKIDGCSKTGILFRIILPTIKPGILAVGIFAFMKSWDDFLFSLIIMMDNAKKTLPVGLAQSFLGEYVHDYGGMMALSVCATVPVLLLFIFFQKYMISGMTSGAVKG